MIPSMAIKMATSTGLCILMTCTADLVTQEKKKMLMLSAVIWSRAWFLWAPFIFVLRMYDNVLPLTVFATLIVFGGILMSVVNYSHLKSFKEVNQAKNSQEKKPNIVTISDGVEKMKDNYRAQCDINREVWIVHQTKQIHNIRTSVPDEVVINIVHKYKRTGNKTNESNHFLFRHLWAITVLPCTNQFNSDQLKFIRSNEPTEPRRVRRQFDLEFLSNNSLVRTDFRIRGMLGCWSIWFRSGFCRHRHSSRPKIERYVFLRFRIK